MTKSFGEIFRCAAALGIIGCVVTAALAGTNQLTEGIIAKQAIAAETAARREVMEADDFTKESLQDTIYYTAQKEGRLVGYVFTAHATGKSAGLVIMTGIDTNGVVTGVAITAENETAGYVDKVKAGGLMHAFVNQPALPFQLGGNVDGVSQATKTSKGIVDGVNQAVAWYQQVKGGGTP